MDLDAVRWNQHFRNTVIAIVVLWLYQVWQGALDISLIVLVVALYLGFAIPFDLLRHRIVDADR
ncbi:hypothetical protein [Halovivax gelatinilyticus]|uniref:hypothetical protein n=1 Tax=Halovivax gelatinilyticus TaxID=2961597 RepID=UPI0020CA8255|nr:hypothetical protein [Halovivax gelatinilyticus]